MEEHCVVEGLIGSWHGHRLHERDKVEARWPKGFECRCPNMDPETTDEVSRAEMYTGHMGR